MKQIEETKIVEFRLLWPQMNFILFFYTVLGSVPVATSQLKHKRFMAQEIAFSANIITKR